jgi:hypothetical protein
MEHINVELSTLMKIGCVVLLIGCFVMWIALPIGEHLLAHAGEEHAIDKPEDPHETDEGDILEGIVTDSAIAPNRERDEEENEEEEEELEE